ncbi:MAG TPA: ribonuclease H-like domain-containing protein [Methanocorpusculum sp.]|nr:ribonuclease H-like domain-containing protein [Methanocorpusculum sp.]
MQAVEAQFIPGIFLKESIAKPEFPEGIEVETADGACMKFKQYYAAEPKQIDEAVVRDRLMHELTLVPGIGEARAEEMRRQGITTLSGLGKTRFKEIGEVIADIIENDSPKEISILFQDVHRGNDPLLLGFAGCAHESQIFFDIETMGMAHSPIILFGIGEYSRDGLKVTQYLARDIGEELPALLKTAAHFHADSRVISYNGKVFDIPYLNDRLAYYGEQCVRPRLHFDLLFTTRKMFGDALPNCRLGTVEDYILNLPRHDDLPGYLVPEYYRKWLILRDAEILRPIVKHNEADVGNLAALLHHQQDLLYGC